MGAITACLLRHQGATQNLVACYLADMPWLPEPPLFPNRDDPNQRLPTHASPLPPTPPLWQVVVPGPQLPDKRFGPGPVTIKNYSPNIPKPPVDDPDTPNTAWVGVNEAATILGCSVASVRMTAARMRWAKTEGQRKPGCKGSRPVLYAEAQVRAFAAGRARLKRFSR